MIGSSGEAPSKPGDRSLHLRPPEFNIIQSLLGVFWSVWFARLSTQSLESTGSGWLPSPVSLVLLKIVYVIGVTVAISLLVLGSRRLQQLQTQMEQMEMMDQMARVDVRQYAHILRHADWLTLLLGLIVVALPLYSVLFFDGVNIYQAVLSALLFVVFLLLIRSYR